MNRNLAWLAEVTVSELNSYGPQTAVRHYSQSSVLWARSGRRAQTRDNQWAWLGKTNWALLVKARHFPYNVICHCLLAFSGFSDRLSLATARALSYFSLSCKRRGFYTASHSLSPQFRIVLSPIKVPLSAACVPFKNHPAKNDWRLRRILTSLGLPALLAPTRAGKGNKAVRGRRTHVSINMDLLLETQGVV